MRYILFLLPILFCYCRSETTENQLIVSVEKIALRATPGLKGAEILTLRQGEKLLDLGVVSHFESEISFGDEARRTPWLKVKTSDNLEGWVFAGAVNPTVPKDDWLLQKRLDCYFGHAFASRRNTWTESLSGLQTDGQYAIVFRDAIAIRDSMVYLLGRRAEPEGVPDYRWLADVLPGFVYQRAAVGGPPHLFADYRFWLQKAQKTEGAADEAFLETCFMVFPQDSIESIFPVWKFQLSELESASQLGTGVHGKVLQQIDKTLAKSRLFEPELLRIKDALLEDILDKNTQFWQSGALTAQELAEIVATPPACLSATEISALQLRRVMLEAAAENGIRANLRSGE